MCNNVDCSAGTKTLVQQSQYRTRNWKKMAETTGLMSFPEDQQVRRALVRADLGGEGSAKGGMKGALPHAPKLNKPAFLRGAWQSGGGLIAFMGN
jgi:hypothetical protein